MGEDQSVCGGEGPTHIKSRMSLPEPSLNKVNSTLYVIGREVKKSSCGPASILPIMICKSVVMVSAVVTL